MACVRRRAVISGNFISSGRQRLAWLLGWHRDSKPRVGEEREEARSRCFPWKMQVTLIAIPCAPWPALLLLFPSLDERQIDDGDLSPFNDSPSRARTRNDWISSRKSTLKIFFLFEFSLSFSAFVRIDVNRLNFEEDKEVGYRSIEYIIYKCK